MSTEVDLGRFDLCKMVGCVKSAKVTGRGSPRNPMIKPYNAEHIFVNFAPGGIGQRPTSRSPFKMSSQQAQVTTSAPGKLWGGRFTGERSSLQLPKMHC